MNEGRYAVFRALCGDTLRNVVMVGDQCQSPYGFNKSGLEYMDRFGTGYGAKLVELTPNYRSSRSVGEFAQTLDSDQMVHQKLPLLGSVAVLRGDDGKHEAQLIADELERLLAIHPFAYAISS